MELEARIKILCRNPYLLSIFAFLNFFFYAHLQNLDFANWPYLLIWGSKKKTYFQKCSYNGQIRQGTNFERFFFFCQNRTFLKALAFWKFQFWGKNFFSLKIGINIFRAFLSTFLEIHFLIWTLPKKLLRFFQWEVAWFLHANSGLPGRILKCLTSKHIRKTSGIRIWYRRAQRNAATRTRTLFKTRTGHIF